MRHVWACLLSLAVGAQGPAQQPGGVAETIRTVAGPADTTPIRVTRRPMRAHSARSAPAWGGGAASRSS